MRRPWTPIFEELEGEQICRIPLSRGLFAIIDAKYIVEVIRYAWCVVRSGGIWYYASTHVRLPDGRSTKLRLHTLIWRLRGMEEGPVDHKNNDGLDCRASNLRPGPPKLNSANNRKQAAATSKYKGVSWYARHSKWKVEIQVDGKKQHIGYFAFEDEELAARAYDAAALAAWGVYAKLNFPQELVA